MKQAIVVNEALKLPRGKLAAQVAHASVGAFLEASLTAQQCWLEAGMPKVVLQCDSDSTLFDLEKLANESGLPAMLIRDAGHTVVEAGTITCLGIGPAEIEAIDRLTGAMKLVK
jgi:peptidyl-tRNA hydrolase